MSAMGWIVVAIVFGRGAQALYLHFQARQSGQSRLAALRSGAEERYFEERRELEAYPSRAATPPLWHGLSAVVVALLIAASLMAR